MISFKAAPLWVTDLKDAQVLAVPAIDETVLKQVFLGVEYRGIKAHEKTQLTLERSDHEFARPPTDLPALLRTADQLLVVARQDAGEHGHLQYCACGTRFAFPFNQQHNVSVRCQRCGATLEADPHRSQQMVASDAAREQTNGVRTGLASFFREAMARGFTVYAVNV
jgi:hypothetical protein